MKCPACRQNPEVVSLRWSGVSGHWCDAINSWLFTNGRIWSSDTKLFRVLAGER